MSLQRQVSWNLAALVTGVALTLFAALAASSRASSAAPAPARATSRAPAVALHKVVGGLPGAVYLTAPPGDTHRLFIVQKGGVIRIVKDGALVSRPFLKITAKISTGGEQGLLSMAFDPNFAANRRVYVDYTNVAGDTRVVRYVASAANSDVAAPSSARVLLKVNQPYANHNGGQLQFGPDGHLYIGLGDGGSEGDPNLVGQNLHTRLAKILRMNVNASRPGASLYAYGLRNPWRFSFDSKTGNLWIGDVGQDRWEEVDFLKAGTRPGANFGWSYYEGNHVYKPQPIRRARLVYPVAEYAHSDGCAVTGGYVYRGSAIPALRGDYLFADFCSGRVWLKTSRAAAKQIVGGISQKLTQISSFGQDASGELYLVSLAGDVYRIVP